MSGGPVVFKEPFSCAVVAAFTRLCLCFVSLALMVAWPGGTPLGAAERGPEESLAWDVPGDVPQMMAACKEIPSLYQFSRNGYLGIECGYQAILLGDRIPIAPAQHVPWAKPYARGTLKVLAITMFGNAPADTKQVAQVARELDCEMRFVLIAHVPVGMKWGLDDAYRLGYLAEQAREALKRDYDVILLALGSYSPRHGYPLATSIFPDDVYQTILKKVKAGTGLVFVGSNMGGWWVDKTPLIEAAPAERVGTGRLPEEIGEVHVEPAGGSNVFVGAPLKNLPPFPLYDWKLKEDSRVIATESGKPLVMTGLYGKGRTVLLGWDGTLAPVASWHLNRLQFEHGMATTLRAIAYAAAAEPPVLVNPLEAKLKAGAHGEAIVTTSGRAELHCTLRNEEFETLHESVVSSGGGDTVVPLPALPAGRYWLDVIARDKNGAALGWGSGLVEAVSEESMVLAADRDVYKVGETVHITGRLQPGKARSRVEMRIRDAAGRLVASGSAQAADRFAFDYKVADARVAPHTATVTAYRGGSPLVRERIEFFVPNHRWEDYENILWPDYKSMLPGEVMRDAAGITAIMGGWGRDMCARMGAPAGIRQSRMNDAVIAPGTVQKDPEKGATEHDAVLKQAIEASRKYGAVCWAFQDERHQNTDPGMPNAEGLRRYREYLKKQYGTLAKLNEEWGGELKSWEEVKPMLTEDLTPETKNLAPWVDFRLYVADQVFQADSRHARMVKDALGEDCSVGIDGFTTSGHMIPYGATDIGRLLTEGVFNFYCPYGDDLMIASMIKGRLVKYIGWRMSRREYFGYPWRDAFRGHWGTFRFFGPTFFSQFGWVQPAGRWIEEGTRELRQGVGKLLMGAKRQLAPVAFLYSYPSMMTVAAAGVWVEPGNDHLMWRPANWSRKAFEQMLQKCGVSAFRYVTTAQAQRGALKDVKLLIIPHFMGIALSDETCAAVKQFVSEGGIVVADLAPAVCDEHGKLRDKGGLDGLFGVTRNEFAYAVRGPDYLVGVTEKDPMVAPNAWYIGEWYEKNLRVTDGKLLGKHWFLDVPAFVVKDTGKGRALLLNFLHTSCVRRNGEPEPDEVRLMEYVLRAAAVEPQAFIETDYGVAQQENYEVNTLRDGPAEYVGVYAPKSPEEPGSMVIRFPTARHTYDVRGRKYLGVVDRAPLPIRAYGAVLFARLDYEITGLSVNAGDVEAGGAVPIMVTVNASKRPGRHVVRLEVLDPTGRPNSFYSHNVDVVGGAYRGVIHTALDDPEGTWTIRAREVISGREAVAQFRLR